uniref:Complement component 5 protein n=1 Tax=Ginglymostoma cirratum TaxID=7801 RepID=C7S852_GINCI|nr:complement component 5 protein [Ginglymostoma cirratum]
MKLLFIISFVALLRSNIGQERTYLVTAPKIFRVGATETVVIQTYGYTNSLRVLISLSSYPDRKKIFSEGGVTINKENGFQASLHLTISPKDLPRKKNEKQYVYLKARSEDFNQEGKVPVTYHNGMLFIQTDKPVYTPDQSVKFRIYSLNEEVKPARRPVVITFQDPEGVKVDYAEYEDITGIISAPDFKIPSNPKYGLWKIEAVYKNDFSTSTSTQFEIKEYVLPTFQISIKPEKNYISFKEFERFTITITASYFYKKTITSAYVFIRFGILEKDGTKHLLPHAAQTLRMSNGEVTVQFNTKAATEVIHRGSIEDLDGDFLYIGVTIQDSSAEISEDADYTRVMFTESPYTINLVATPLFIKPKLPYYIIAQVKDILGQPVGDTTVTISTEAVFEGGERRELIAEDLNQEKQTRRDDGTVLFIFNAPADIQELEFKIKVITLDDDLPISKSYTAEAYQSVSKSYPYITWTGGFQKFHVGDYLNVNLVASSPYLNKIKHFHYQVVSKGKIVLFETKDRPVGNQIFSLNIPITREMIPSARLIAYYVVTGENNGELVVDSLWFDVEEKCLNNQQILLSTDSVVYKPGSQMDLRISAQPNSLVALSSIDTAVYAIRKGSKLSIEKVLLDAEKHDLGCGAGAGRNNADVFKRAGLMFLTNANAKALPDTDTKCDVILRPKRDLKVMAEIRKKVARFTNPLDQKCCMDGMKNYPLRHSCTARASRIKLPDPRRTIFLECCNFAQTLRLKSESDLTLGRMELNNEFELEPPRIRSIFQKAGCGKSIEIPESSDSQHLLKVLPDSLTTWEVQGVGISGTGICVADPIKVTVYQDVILKAKLPYSVVRGEQVQLRASVYSYQRAKTKVCVQLSTDEGTCLFKGSQTSIEGRQHTACQRRTLEGFSALPFTFTILPLKIGVHNINFTLKTQFSANEITVHKLNVVPEGIKKEKNFPYVLDPANVLGRMVRRIEIHLKTPLNILPNVKPKNVLTVQGDIIGESMSIALDPEGVHKLTNLPRGSAESELMNVAPIYFIYNYLERTNNWNVMGPNRLKIQLNMKKQMKDGITSIMSFRTKNVYSYSMWKDRQGSTWLTAFVLRVFAQVNDYLTMDEQAMCSTITWLISNCQNSDGSFQELSNYVPSRFQVIKDETKERTMYLTAFTSIAIQKAFYTCETETVRKSILKADEYLSHHLENVKSTLVLAMTAYALALRNQNSRFAYRALEKLKYEASVKGNPPSHRFWKDISEKSASGVEVTARIVETTSYALLAVLHSTDKTYGNPIVQWLTEQQRYGGGFLSTQDTVTALESLTEYVINMKRTKLSMSITVDYRRLGHIQKFELNEEKAFTRPLEIEKNDNVVVRSSGRTGTAIVNMRTVYYVISAPSETCDFSLRIEATKVISDTRPAGVETVYRLEACAQYIPRPEEYVYESGHSVMEITLNTGLIPEEDDLKILLYGVDGLISDYRVSDKSVILQVDSIPSDDLFCVGFRVYEMMKVGMVTAVPFTVYDYHSPDRRCTIFYNPTGENKLLKLCSGDECKCMKAECSEIQPLLDITLDAQNKREAACSRGPVYAYKVQILSSEEQFNFIKYNATIVEIFMTVDAVEENSVVTLIKKDTCSDVTLNNEQTYLIMGKNSLRLRPSSTFMYEYPLDSSNWIEMWPSEKECSGEACGIFLQQMEDFSISLLINGC